MPKNLVNITNSAFKQLSRIAEKEKNKNILFSVKGGGCSHSRYNPEIIRHHFDTSYRYKIEPMNFDPYPELKVIENNNFNLYLCDYSIKHIRDCTIDWREDLMEHRFHFNNPASVYEFACGKSFMSKHKY